MKKEAFILRTISLHSSPGVVHIETVGYDESEGMLIEFDAKALIEDIPSLYTIAKQAIEQDKEHETKKYVKFKQLLSEDWKGKRGKAKTPGE